MAFLLISVALGGSLILLARTAHTTFVANRMLETYSALLAAARTARLTADTDDDERAT